MSELTYNGVSLPYPLTTQFTQEAVDDDAPGGLPTDWISLKFDITVQTIINASYLEMLAPGLVGRTTNPADIMQRLRTNLMTKRKALSFKFNGKELIPKVQLGNKGTVDARNGPSPQSCTFMELTDTTFLMTYRIVAYYWEANLFQTTAAGNLAIVNLPSATVLFNRWTETVEFDNCQMATRTREGKFMIRSDNSQGRIADEMREQMAVTSIPPGFLRASSRYTVSPDGLAIAYTIIDKEAYKMPPPPAFEAEGEYTESCGKLGAIRHAEMRVKLKGDNSLRSGVDKQPQLILACFAVIFQKLKMRGAGVLLERGQTSPNGTLESFSMRVWLYENIVECNARVMFRFNKSLLFGGPHPIGAITTTPLSTDIKQYTPAYRGRGHSNILLQAASYYDPTIGGILGPGKENNISLDVHVGNQDQQMPGKAPGQAGKDGG